jgi:hypothetical protein
LLCISGPYNLFYVKIYSVHIISEAYTPISVPKTL